jgi:hypothetical protein
MSNRLICDAIRFVTDTLVSWLWPTSSTCIHTSTHHSIFSIYQCVHIVRYKVINMMRFFHVATIGLNRFKQCLSELSIRDNECWLILSVYPKRLRRVEVGKAAQAVRMRSQYDQLRQLVQRRWKTAQLIGRYVQLVKHLELAYVTVREHTQCTHVLYHQLLIVTRKFIDSMPKLSFTLSFFAKPFASFDWTKFENWTMHLANNVAFFSQQQFLRRHFCLILTGIYQCHDD